MGFNLAVFAWKQELDSAAKRKKAGVTFEAVLESILESGKHPALEKGDFAGFEKALEERLGPKGQGKGPEELPYTVERYPRARILRLAHADVPKLAPIITVLARKFGLTSAGNG